MTERGLTNVEKKIDELRTYQIELISQFRLKSKEIVKIGRKIKGLKRRISAARDEIDRVEREVGMNSEQIQKTAAQVRKTTTPADGYDMDRDILLDAERRVLMAQRKIDQIEMDASLNADQISELIEIIKL